MINEVKLGVSVGAGDIAHLTIGGDLNSEAKEKIELWMTDVKKVIKDLYDKKGEQVLCLVDIKDLKTYHPDVLLTLAGLMKENEPYVLRTATFGGSKSITMAEDVVIALSGRNNLQAFDTKEQAVNWLRTGIDASTSSN